EATQARQVLPGPVRREVLDQPLLVGEEEDHVLAAEPLAPGGAGFRRGHRLVGEPERRREPRRGGGPRPGAEQLFAGQTALTALLFGHYLILLKTSTALLSCEVE